MTGVIPKLKVSRCEIFVGITESTQGIIRYNSSALGSNLQVKIALCLILYLDRSLDLTTQLPAHKEETVMVVM